MAKNENGGNREEVPLERIGEIVFQDHDELRYWEQRGYSHTAEPWLEDRFQFKPKIRHNANLEFFLQNPNYFIECVY